MHPANTQHESAETRPSMAASDLPSISVVVIGRNEGPRLDRCLTTVRAADYPAERLELIYVDSQSTDDSCEIAARHGARVIRIEPERPTAAVGRNAGLGVAVNEFVHFLDGDTELHPAWLRRAVQEMKDPAVVGVFGRREEINPRATVYNFWTHHDWYVPPGRVEACGGDVLFRREALRAVGGYDDGLIAGEERDLCHRLLRNRRSHLLRLDEPMTRHDIAMTRFGQYWKRCYRAGYAYAQVASRYADLLSWRRTCLRNLLHAAILLSAIGLSLGLWSPWPLAVWSAALLLALLRTTWRQRGQVGSWGGSLLYAIHHYLSKVPIVLGHLDYFLRRLFRRQPRRLVEYRG